MASKFVAADKALKFFEVVGKLKLLKRTGWVQRNIPHPESVAEHMYRMSMLSFLIVDPMVNKDHLMKICMVHDLAEAVVGDITPNDGVSKEEKRRLEETALNNIVNDLDYPEIADMIRSLWLEYEEGDSVNALVAKQLDKYEMIVQADEYEQANNVRLDEFFESTKGYFTHPEIALWSAELLSNRTKRLEENEEILKKQKR